MARILDRWPGAVRDHWKILTEDGAVMILSHERDAGIWSLRLYARGREIAFSFPPEGVDAAC